MRKRWKWIAVIGAVVAGLAALFFLTPAPRVIFTAVKPPLPAGYETNVPFHLVDSRFFSMGLSNNWVEAVTASGTTNYQFNRIIYLDGRSLPLNVLVPEETTRFRAKIEYLESTPYRDATMRFVTKFRWSRSWFFLIFPNSHPKDTMVWSPWLVKTNGMWAEEP